MVVQLVVGGDGGLAAPSKTKWVVRRVTSTTYLVSKHTEANVKAQLVGLLAGLGDTLKVIIKFAWNVGKTTLKKSWTRTKAWRLFAVTSKGSVYCLQVHYVKVLLFGKLANCLHHESLKETESIVLLALMDDRRTIFLATKDNPISFGSQMKQMGPPRRLL